jgi:hypothetical protein
LSRLVFPKNAEKPSSALRLLSYTNSSNVATTKKVTAAKKGRILSFLTSNSAKLRYVGNADDVTTVIELISKGPGGGFGVEV